MVHYTAVARQVREVIRPLERGKNAAVPMAASEDAIRCAKVER
jgi:hypothetical protein